MSKTIFIFIFNFLAILVVAQDFDIDALKAKYPNQPIVYTFKNENIIVSNDKNGLSITKHIKEQFVILTEQGKNFNSRVVYKNAFIDAKNIKAINYIPNGKKYSKVVVDNIKVNDANTDGTFYDDSKKITITYPSGVIGSIIDLEYDEVYLEPRFFGSFYVTESYPVIKANCELRYPTSVSINIKEFNAKELKVLHTEKAIKNEIVNSWEIDSVPAFKFEENGPNFKTLACYFLFNVKDYQKENVKIPLVGSVSNLYKWYMELVRNLNKTPSPHLKYITDSLTANCKTDIEKVKKIYYWVQDKIAYIAYEDGLGGFIPREADIICKRRFGDCKDMASIIVSMGKAADLPIYLTWIGTRDIPYQFSEIPAPMAANHMIATYLTADTCFFLDATSRHQDLGLHTAFIQGKEGIIGISDTEYKIKVVPQIRHDKNYVSDSVTIQIHDKGIYGSGILKLGGYYKVSMQNRIDGKSYREQFDYLSSYCEKGNNKFKLDTFIVLQNKRDLPIEILYKFKTPNYVTETKTETFVNLNFDKNHLSDYTTTDRKIGYEFNFAFEKNLVVNLIVNAAYTFKNMPDSINYSKDNFEYVTSYSKTSSSILFKSSIRIKDKSINTSQFEAWNLFLNEINSNNNKLISLNKL